MARYYYSNHRIALGIRFFCAALFVTTLLVMSYSGEIIEVTPYRMIKSFAKGDIQYIYSAECEMLNSVKNSSMDNVVVVSKNFRGLKWSNVATNKVRRGAYWRNSEISEYYGKASLSCIIDIREWIRVLWGNHGEELSNEQIDEIVYQIVNKDEEVYVKIFDMFDSDYHRNDMEYVKSGYRTFLNRTEEYIEYDFSAINAWSEYIYGDKECRYNFVKALLESEEFRYDIFALDMYE